MGFNESRQGKYVPVNGDRFVGQTANPPIKPVDMDQAKIPKIDPRSYPIHIRARSHLVVSFEEICPTITMASEIRPVLPQIGDIEMFDSGVLFPTPNMM